MTDLRPVDSPPASDLDLDLEVSREEMLEAIPLHVVLHDGVDLDAPDPALTDSGRRVCVAERRAGGRCTAAAPHGSLLCNAHSGVLDPSKGGHARAQALRDRAETEEERDRLRRLGTRALIADTLERRAREVQRTVETLLQLAAEGDKDAAKALIPWLNQGLGMPTERVQLDTPSSAADLSEMSTADLLAFAQRRRLEAVPSPADEQAESA